MQEKIQNYLDANASAPLVPGIYEGVNSWIGQVGSLFPNPSSIHFQGRLAKKALLQSRQQIAHSLKSGVELDRLVFTSSGSEANQWVIRSAWESYQQKKDSLQPCWVTTAIEHDSILQMIPWWKRQGGQVQILPVDASGVVQWDSFLEQEDHSHIALISAQWVNAETGVIHPIHPLVVFAKKKSIPIHIDAAQAWGKIDLDLGALDAEYVTFSGHKIGAFAGTGFIRLGTNQRLLPLIFGKQEKGRRGGTENGLGMIALGIAASHVNPTRWFSILNPLKIELERRILEQISETRITGKQVERVANTTHLYFKGVQGDGLVMALDLAGYCVSAGSACSSGVLEPSSVMLAMGYSKSEAMAGLRISLHEWVPLEVIHSFVEALKKVVERIRKASC